MPKVMSYWLTNLKSFFILNSIMEIESFCQQLKGSIDH